MHPLQETRLEKRTHAGVLLFSQMLGAPHGWAVAVDPRAQRVVAATERGLFSFALDGSDRVFDERIQTRTLCPHGDAVVVGWFNQDGAMADVDPVTLASRPRAALGAAIHAIVAVSPDVLAVSDNLGRITLLDPGEPRTLAKRAHAMVSIAALDDGSVAAASLAKTIYVFDPRGGKRVWEGLPSIPYRLAAHGDTIAAGVGKRVWIVRAEDGAEPALFPAHEGLVSALAFDAEGTLRTAGEEGWIRVWPRHARGYGPTPASSIAGKGHIQALTCTADAIYLLRRTRP